MKVLLIEPCHVNFGGYYRAFNIGSALAKRDNKVDFLCASERKFNFTIKKTKLSKNFSRFELPRFYFHFYFNGRILRGLIGLFFGLFGRYDIIHLFTTVQLESIIPAFFLKLIGKQIVVDWDDYWQGTYENNQNKLINNYLRFCETKAPKFFGNIIVTSDFLRNLAEKMGARKILKMINYVDTEQFQLYTRKQSRIKLQLDLSGKYVLAFGNTYSKDRFYLLCKLFEYIYHLDRTVILLFNDDPIFYLKAFRLEETFNPNIYKNIVNVGYIREKDLGYYLAATNATLLITADTDNERACFPIRIGSYLNGESVIIMNNINSEYAHTLSKYKCTIIDQDLHQLALKTTAFLSNNRLQVEMKKNAKRAKNELSWNKSVNYLIDYYKHL